MHNIVSIRRALISVSDKTGLEPLARALHAAGIEMISTGGTLKQLTAFGLPVTPIEAVTGNPESFGGRMKTLSFQVMSALLFRRDHAQDQAEAEALNIRPIDMVVCNLYPFEETVQRDPSFDALIENIDIGGPTMIRAAAKNHHSVAVVTDPAQYYDVINALSTHKSGLPHELCQRLCRAAFQYTARYDAAIAAKLEQIWPDDTQTLSLSAGRGKTLRYGENPHQKAWVHVDALNPGLAGAVPLQGKEMSYNNLLDADAAWRVCGDMARAAPEYPAAVSIIKHLNPCGAAVAATNLRALELAWAGDPISSFGGILCFNTPVDGDVAQWLSNKFIEVIVAPAYTDGARAIFADKVNLRLIDLPPYDGQDARHTVRSISGGWLVQEEDNGPDRDLRDATARGFTPQQKNLARFGTMVCKHLKSNAIALVHAPDNALALAGAGMGNPNRLISLQQAIDKARENGHDDLSGTVLISDAFFPFADNIDLAAQNGIRAIVQPGGSIKDKDVIAACERHNIAMMLTGRRHFRH